MQKPYIKILSIKDVNNNNSPILLTTITGNGNYTYSGSDKQSLTKDNFLVCVNYCSQSNASMGFSSTTIATKNYNPTTGVLSLSNMVFNSSTGSYPGTYTFRANVYLVK